MNRLIRLLQVAGPGWLADTAQQGLWVALLAILGPRLLGKRFWPGLAIVLGSSAVLSVAVGFLTTPINPDTIFYLADSWSAPTGRLPMRMMVFRPFFLLPRSGDVVYAANLATCGLCILCGTLAGLMVWRLSGHRYVSLVTGALAVVWLVQEGEMVFARPDYFMCSLVCVGLALLVLPQKPAPGAAFLCLSLAGSMGPRHILFLLAALLASLFNGLLRERWKSILGGIALGGCFNFGYILAFDSIGNILRYNTAAVGDQQLLVGLPKFPPVVLLIALLALLTARWPGRWNTVGFFWGASMLSLSATPQNFTHWVLTSFLLYSLVLIGAWAGRLTQSTTPLRQAVAAFILVMSAWQPVSSLADRLSEWPGYSAAIQQTASDCRLFNWLASMARQGPVACVTCHPIRARNVWALYNASEYPLSFSPQRFAQLAPDIQNCMSSGVPVVIEWAPYPTPEAPNVVDYLAQRIPLSPVQAAALADALRSHYRLVQYRDWQGPKSWGPGQFLVRRDVPVDDQGQILDDRLIRGKESPDAGDDRHQRLQPGVANGAPPVQGHPTSGRGHKPTR
ncbi:MAG TPA: hypothetical protein VGO93_00080 [Candidatus Xenobia bacterium]|jgi:hypothetical protein